MAIKKSELYSSLWKSCDELRGGMDASQYKDYVLVLLFVKYVSDKYAGDPNSLIEVPEGGERLLASKFGTAWRRGELRQITVRRKEVLPFARIDPTATLSQNGNLDSTSPPTPLAGVRACGPSVSWGRKAQGVRTLGM